MTEESKLYAAITSNNWRREYIGASTQKSFRKTGMQDRYGLVCVDAAVTYRMQNKENMVCREVHDVPPLRRGRVDDVVATLGEDCFRC